MPAPSPDAILDDPPPLNATDFPFRVDAFPASWLAEFGQLMPVVSQGEAPVPLPNPFRYEN